MNPSPSKKHRDDDESRAAEGRPYSLPETGLLEELLESVVLVLAFPKLMSVGWSRRIIDTCNQGLQCADDEVLFDLSRVEFLAPFGVTILSATLHRCIVAGKRCTYRRPRMKKTAEYLQRIGFEARLIKGGPAPTYVPTSVELRRFTAIDPIYGEQLVAFLNTKRPLSEEAQFQLRMHLLELMQNAQDHAESGLGFWVCAQSYPSKGNVRISFVDLGRGIPTVLRTLPQYAGTGHDAELVYHATRQGVTTRVGRPGGMGLFFIREYVRRSGGTMTILSERGRVVFRPRGVTGGIQKHRFGGTAIDIVLNRRGMAR